MKVASLFQKLRQFCRMRGFYVLEELHQAGSAAAAYAAGLFLQRYNPSAGLLANSGGFKGSSLVRKVARVWTLSIERGGRGEFSLVR